MSNILDRQEKVLVIGKNSRVKTSKVATVALFGTSPLSLILGRSCALREISVLSVYEPDPQAALRASLYLGVSARSTPEHILTSGAEVVLAVTVPPAELMEKCTRVLLLSKPDPNALPNELTWIESVDGLALDQEPTTIASRPPELTFHLGGSRKKELTEFLNQLSDSFAATATN